MKLLTVLGARPNFIKAFLISRELKKRGHREIIVHSGQHYDYLMNEIFFKDLNIPKPDFNLNLRGEQINKIIEEMKNSIKKINPDLVLIYGDTNSSLAGAIAAFLNRKPIVHIEAGVRTFDLEMPEERNRIIIDHYSKLLFCPTKDSLDNLIKEKVAGKSYFTGDVMLDAVQYITEKNKLNYYSTLKLFPKEYLLLTLHRQENVDNKDNLLKILSIFNSLENYPIVFPVHPRTGKSLKQFGLLGDFSKRFLITDPLGYSQILSLVKYAKIVFTDSGGLQKEAFFLNTPCITFLRKSGWTKIVDSGWNKAVGLDKRKALDAFAVYKNSSPKPVKENYFGNGDAYLKTIGILEKYFLKK